MAKCKDCLHFEACKYMYEAAFDQQLFPFGTFDFGTCDQFKDRSRFVELPCKPGDHVYRFCGTKNNRYVGERLVHSVTIYGDGSFVILSSAYDTMGKTVFLTREEAESELARRTANG